MGAGAPTTVQAGMQVIVADHVELLDSWFREAIAERKQREARSRSHAAVANRVRPFPGPIGDYLPQAIMAWHASAKEWLMWVLSFFEQWEQNWPARNPPTRSE